MHLVVGLGNPGRRYAGTRHNIGWRVVEKVAERHRGAHFIEEGWAETARVAMAGKTVLLAKPETYVNLSGTAVADLRKRHRVPPGQILVMYDDLDLPVGQLRLRMKGGHGGHNGMRSVIEALGTPEFPRLRIGIGRPPEGVDPAEHVLTRFTEEEARLMEEVVDRAADAVEVFVRQGIEAAMNTFNPRRQRPSEPPGVRSADPA